MSIPITDGKNLQALDNGQIRACAGCRRPGSASPTPRGPRLAAAVHLSTMPPANLLPKWS
ncbi:hypothetical protein [Pseudoduganella sp. R-34]|uniref:hypothetical protein n=1 Tax=Pseudoduganella sp. R-34 TaxID=3404062 RepID=UPI003CEE7B13